MIIGGLDIAATTGAAVLKDGVHCDGDRWEITTQTYRGQAKKKSILDNDLALDPTHEGHLGKDFEDFLLTWILSNRIEHVAIEAPLPSNNERRKTHVDTSASWAGQALVVTKEKATSFASVYRNYGLSYIACSTCRRLNIPVTLIAQSTWRKVFLGNGRPADAKKEAKLMCARWGISISSADAAEAVGIVWTLHRQLNPYSAAANGLFDKAG